MIVVVLHQYYHQQYDTVIERRTCATADGRWEGTPGWTMEVDEMMREEHVVTEGARGEEETNSKQF